MPTVHTTDIDGLTITLMPRFGDALGAVLHMLPGGDTNPDCFPGGIHDVYAFTAQGKGTFRGGHFHPVLDELFFPMSGTALWLLSDFREASPTFGKTVGVVLGISALGEFPLPHFTLQENGILPRICVPHGVYHAIFPLTDEQVIVAALGSTPYHKEDYRYPTLQDIPRTEELLQLCNIPYPEPPQQL